MGQLFSSFGVSGGVSEDRFAELTEEYLKTEDVLRQVQRSDVLTPEKFGQLAVAWSGPSGETLASGVVRGVQTSKYVQADAVLDEALCLCSEASASPALDLTDSGFLSKDELKDVFLENPKSMYVEAGNTLAKSALESPLSGHASVSTTAYVTRDQVDAELFAKKKGTDAHANNFAPVEGYLDSQALLDRYLPGDIRCKSLDAGRLCTTGHNTTFGDTLPEGMSCDHFRHMLPLSLGEATVMACGSTAEEIEAVHAELDHWESHGWSQQTTRIDGEDWQKWTRCYTDRKFAVQECAQRGLDSPQDKKDCARGAHAYSCGRSCKQFGAGCAHDQECCGDSQCVNYKCAPKVSRGKGAARQTPRGGRGRGRG